jgi:hypothetical protein
MEAADHTHSYSENGSTEQSPLAAQEAAEHQADRPEIPVLAALAGGFLLAKLIGAFGGDDD